ncbi:MAG: RagB/SusD family nutrient uptake outer membrane protein [Ferruginibacter sp.]
MKKLFIIPVVLITVFTSCGKLLEKEPDNRTKLDSPEKISQLLGSAYPQLNYQPMAELASDNVDDLITQSLDAPDWLRLTSDLYTYNDNTGSATSEDTPEGYWFACYRAIAASNLALSAIAKVPETEQRSYRAQKGEALVARAYSHFMLVNFFAKFYNPATAGTDPGIPYVTEPEEVSIKKYERKTVQYVYDMIEQDLQQGLPLIDDNNYKVPKYHFNRTAANAFASRYYLHKKEMDSVIKYATAAIPETSFKNYLRPWNTIYTNLDLNGNGNLSQVYGKATENANLLLAESRSWWLRLFGTGRYGVSDELSNYASDEVHAAGGVWSYRVVFFLQGHNFIPKIDEYFVETSIGSGIGDGWQMVTLLSAEEVLFNLAEAYAYKGQDERAMRLLDTYLSTRIDGYDATDNAVTAEKLAAFYDANPDKLKFTPFVQPTGVTKQLINIIMDYKQLEFVEEGMRWFDILRYGVTVQHNQYDENGALTDTHTLDPGNVHRVFQLPAAAISQAGLQGNR